jgi:hypothetical protein
MLLLEVPCVFSPETRNVLVNPLHSQASELKIVDVIDHPSTNASSDDS